MAEDPKITLYESLHQAHFPVVEALVLRQDVEPTEASPTLTVEIVLGPMRQSESAGKLRARFSDVRNLQLSPVFCPFTLSLLSVHCVKDRQWEGIKYHVEDAEEHQLRFYCRDFSAEALPGDAGTVADN